MRAVAGVLTLLTLVGGVAIESAAAVGSVLYLRGDSVPSASMSSSPPPSGSLPNFDPGREAFPGLLVQKGSGSAGESDPTKYQQWSYPVGGETLSIDEFVIWAAPKDFDEDKTISFNVYVLDCGGSCQVLDSSRVTVSGSGWSQKTVAVDVTNYTFGAGRSLRVKVVVDNDSDDDGWFAYATSTYPANLALSSPAATTTTTTTAPTTMSTTTTPTTTSTAAMATTTTSATTTSTSNRVSPVAPTTIPLEPGTPSTTTPQTEGGVSTTSTTLPALGGTDSGGPPTDPPVGPNDLGSEPSASPQPGGFTPVVASPAQDELGNWLAQASGETRAITPEEGLMVAFSTTVETIRTHWSFALALGALTAILLLIGSRRDHEDEALVITTPLPHRLYGSDWNPSPDR